MATFSSVLALLTWVVSREGKKGQRERDEGTGWGRGHSYVEGLVCPWSWMRCSQVLTLNGLCGRSLIRVHA